MDQVQVTACAADVGGIAAAALERGPLDESGCASLLEGIESRVGRDLGGSGRPGPACGPGCASCCTVNVATLAPEGIALAGFLRRALGAAEAERRGRALLAFHERVRWYDDADRVRGRLACPLLDEARACLVHPVRPLACRSVTSLDPRECRQALAERADGDGEGLVQMNLLQRSLYLEAREALREALVARGLDARSRDVSGMAGVFLVEPSLVARYAAGAPLPLA